MGTLASGLKAPAGSDVFQPDVDINGLANSMHGRIHILAANATARTGLASTCGWTPAASDPLVVLQTDTGALWRYDGTTWVAITDVYAGTEQVLVGTAPSAGVVRRIMSTTVTQTTASDGTMVVNLPATAPNAVVSVQASNATAGTNLTIAIDKAASTLSAIKLKVYFAADSSLYASQSAVIGLTVSYY